MTAARTASALPPLAREPAEDAAALIRPARQAPPAPPGTGRAAQGTREIGLEVPPEREANVMASSAAPGP